MPISLSTMRRLSADKPPRILIYGSPGIGKTTLASEFPDPVFLQLEDGTPVEAAVDGWDRETLSSFGDVMDAVTALYTQDHDFKTLVLDSVTEMQKLIFAETCARGDEKGNAKAQIEDFGYGKGYVYALRIWQELIDGLNALRRDKGMSIVLIAHASVERFDDPETVSYDRYTIDLHNKSVGMIEREMDAILLLKKPVAIKTEDQGFNKSRARADGPADRVIIHTTGKPAFVAKNRFGMPSTVEYHRGQGYGALAPYLERQAAPEPENTVETETSTARAQRARAA